MHEVRRAPAVAGAAWEGQAKPCSRHLEPGEAPDRGRSGPVPGPGLVQPGQRKFPLRTPNPDSEVGPEAGPYLRELSDETSRSESSVSLGSGGGSLSGAAGKAGDFLEKKHQLSPGGRQDPGEAGTPPPRPRSLVNDLWGQGRRTTEGGWVPGEGVGGDRWGSRPIFTLRASGGPGFRNTRNKKDAPWAEGTDRVAPLSICGIFMAFFLFCCGVTWSNAQRMALAFGKHLPHTPSAPGQSLAASHPGTLRVGGIGWSQLPSHEWTSTGPHTR